MLCAIVTGRAAAGEIALLDFRDWAGLVDLAMHERLAPLLHAALRARGIPAAIPPDTWEKLRAEGQDAVIRALVLRKELEHLLAVLAGEPAIPVVLLKGAALAWTVYPHPALRPMGDIDVLVPEGRLGAAKARLLEKGCREAAPEFPEVTAGLRLPTAHHVILASPNVHGLHVEVHATLLPGVDAAAARAADSFWNQTEIFPFPADAKGCSHRLATRLAPAPQLLHLAAHCALAHGAVRRRADLLWLHDIHLLLEKHGAAIDAGELWRAALRLDWETGLATALRQTKEYFGTSCAAALLAAGESRSSMSPVWAAAQAVRLDGFRHGLATVAPRDRTRFVLGVIFPQPEFIRFRYHPRPGWLWPLCYLYRWVDIALSVAEATFAKLLRRRSSAVKGNAA